MATEMAVGHVDRAADNPAAGSVGAGRRAGAARGRRGARAAGAGRRRQVLGVPEQDVLSDHRIGRAEREEDRDVLPHQAIGAERVPGALIQSADHADVSAHRPREIPVRRLRRPGRVESREAGAGLLVLRNRRRRSPSTDGAIVELDLVKALRELPDEARGWLAEKRSVQCQSCKAVSVFDPGARRAELRLLRVAALVPYDEIKAPIRPRACCPSRSPRPTFASRSGAGTRANGSRRTALRRRALVDRVHGVYIPYWTFDAQVVCPWRAEAGHYYYTTETYRDNKGQRQTRQVRHVRWEPASGEVRHFFDDEPVPGTHGVSARLLARDRAVPDRRARSLRRRFPVRLRRRALPGRAARCGRAVAGPDEARSCYGMCAQQVPGDTHRNLEIFPTFSGQTFKHMLVPVWLLTYTYGNKPWQVVVNGYTGRMAGEYPKSFWKIAALACRHTDRRAVPDPGGGRMTSGATERQPDSGAARGKGLQCTTNCGCRPKTTRCRGGRNRCRCRRHISSTAHGCRRRFRTALERAVFGLGCFWGAERKFWQLPGVYTTAVGYFGRLYAESDLPRSLLVA